MSIRTALAAIGAGAVLAAVPTTAHAVDAPTPKCGFSFTDKVGDTASQADNLDLVGAFLNYEDDGSVWANMVLKNLTTDYPGNQNGIRWRFTFSVAGKGYYVGVFRDIIFEPLADPYYDWGNYDGTTEFVDIADGTMYPGENGVISVRIPNEVGIEDGAQISDVAAFTESYTTLAVSETAQGEDSNDAPGASFDVGPCVPPALGVGIGTGKLSAAKASKKRSLVVRLTSAEPVADLKATLRRGKRTYGAGSLAGLSGAGKLKLKLARKIGKGAYVLELTGRVGDQTRKVELPLKIAR